MQTTGIFVRALSKFSAGMQICQHQLDRRHFPFGMDIGRDSPTIVTYRNGSIDMNGYFYIRAKSSEVFIDRIVDDFVNQMMQRPLIRISYEHPVLFQDWFES